MENSHGKLENPPRSATIVGTAVARIVESIATRLVVIMIAMRIGPRLDRKPTPSAAVVVSAVLTGVPLDRDGMAVASPAVTTPIGSSLVRRGAFPHRLTRDRSGAARRSRA